MGRTLPLGQIAGLGGVFSYGFNEGKPLIMSFIRGKRHGRSNRLIMAHFAIRFLIYLAALNTNEHEDPSELSFLLSPGIRAVRRRPRHHGYFWEQTNTTYILRRRHTGITAPGRSTNIQKNIHM